MNHAIRRHIAIYFPLVVLLTLCTCRGKSPATQSSPAQLPETIGFSNTEPEGIQPDTTGPVLQPAEPLPPGSGCTFEAIQKTVRTRLEAVTQCYRNALQTNSSLAGKVKVELGIERGGKLVRRSIFESPLPIDVNACIIDALAGLEFSGDFDKPCVIIYPFVFSASIRN